MNARSGWACFSPPQGRADYPEDQGHQGNRAPRLQHQGNRSLSPLSPSLALCLPLSPSISLSLSLSLSLDIELVLCAWGTSRAPLANMASGWLVVKTYTPRRVVLEHNVMVWTSESTLTKPWWVQGANAARLPERSHLTMPNVSQNQIQS